jgi:hypothetical protein
MKPADRCSGGCIWFFQQARRSIREARRGCASTRRDRTRSAIGAQMRTPLPPSAPAPSTDQANGTTTPRRSSCSAPVP